MPEHAPFPGAPRYRARKRLGAGRAGVVWAAEDLEDGGVVALKSLRWHGGDRLLRLKAEFRALRGIAHPNLVRLHELVVNADSAWITMEAVEGRDLVRHVRSGPEARGGGALTAAEAQALRGLVRQLTEGLAALHAAGRLHRDLKAGNILVGDEGRLVVLDFGLSAAAAAEAHSLVGTVGTMAPEQARGERVGPPADWFAAGCVLFEALTGQPPYPGSLVAALAAKEAGPPALPADAPADLARLIGMLLDPDPTRRPGPAGVLATIGVSPLAPLPRETAALPLHGRRDTLARLSRLQAAGGPRVVHLAGPAGSGAATVARHWRRGLGERAWALHTRVDPRERVPMPALDGLVDALARALRDTPADARQAIPHAAALVARFPVLQAVPGLDWSIDPDDEPTGVGLRSRWARGLSAALEAAARGRRTVLQVDGAQWADPDSMRVLGSLLEGPAGRGRMLLLTGGPVPDAALAALGRPVETMPLPALTPAEVAAMAADRTDGAAPRDLGDTAGLPALVALRCRFPTAPDLAQAAEAARTALHPAEARLLDLLRASDGPLPLPRATAAADVGRSRRARLDGVVASGLATLVPTPEGPAVALAAGPLGAVLRAGLGPEAAASARRRLAEAAGGGGTAMDPIVLRTAAAAAMDAGAAHRAVVLYERLLQALDPDDPDRWRALANRGAALGEAGRPVDAAADLGRAADLRARRAPTDPALPALRRAAAEQGLRAGRVPEGLDRLAAALDDAGLAWPASPRAALGGLVWARLRLRARGLRPAAPPADIAPEDLARVDTCWTAALGLCWVDSIRSAVFQSRYALLALALGEPARVMRALSTEAAFMANEGGARNRQRAADALDRARTLAAEHPQDATGAAIVEICASAAAFFSTEFGHARERAAAARTRLDALPRALSWEALNCDVFGLWAQAWLGDLRGLRDQLEARLAEAGDRGDLLAAATLSVGLPSLAWLADDRPDLAQARADEAMALWSHQGGFHTQHWMNLSARVQVALYRGEGAAAWALVHEAWPDLEGAQMLRLQYIRMDSRFLRGRAGLAGLAAGGVPGRVRRTIAADARSLRAEDVPLCEALGLTLLGGLAAVEGRAADAERWLAQAQAAAEAAGLGLLAWALQVRRGGQAAEDGTAALRAMGVVAPARMVGVWVPG